MHQCTRLSLRPNLRLLLSWLHRLRLASSAGSKGCSAARLRRWSCPRQRLSHLPMTNWESKNPEMRPAVMVVVDATVDASRAPRDVVMAEVKAVATGVAGVDDLSAVSARLALTAQVKTSRVNAWMQKVEPCQSQPIRHPMAHQALMSPKMLAAKKLLVSAALAVAANGVAVAATVSVASAPPLNVVATAR